MLTTRDEFADNRGVWNLTCHEKASTSLGVGQQQLLQLIDMARKDRVRANPIKVAPSSTADEPLGSRFMRTIQVWHSSRVDHCSHVARPSQLEHMTEKAEPSDVRSAGDSGGDGRSRSFSV
jgi:hypothetical protein